MIGRLIAAALLAWLFGVAPARAQMMGVLGGGLNATVVSYQGQGDIVATHAAFYSLQPFTNAQGAAGTTHMIKLRRVADGHTCEVLGILISSTVGGLGNTVSCSTGGDNGTAFATWNTRGTFTGTISGTALTTTGDSCTAAAKDVVGGAGFTNKLVRIATVTSCSAGAGVYTLTVDLHGGSAISVGPETMTDYYSVFVPTWFDISGSTDCSSAACNVTQATTGKQPQFIVVGCATITNGGPCVRFDYASAMRLGSPGTFATLTQPVTMAGVYESTTTNQYLHALFTYDGTNGLGLGANWTGGSGFTVFADGSGNGPSVTIANNIAHSSVGISLTGGTNSTLYTDGTSATATMATTQAAGQITVGGITTFDADDFDGEIESDDIIPGDQTSNRVALCHNDKTNYGLSAATC